MHRIILLLGTLFAATGCTYLTASPSVQGHAFVIRNEYVSSSYWNCDATGGEPVCYQTRKQFTKQPAAK
jgi:hypothetical protein